MLGHLAPVKDKFPVIVVQAPVVIFSKNFFQRVCGVMEPLASRILVRMAGGIASILGAFSFVVVSPCVTNRRVSESYLHTSFLPH